jgi:hypothetical protein
MNLPKSQVRHLCNFVGMIVMLIPCHPADEIIIDFVEPKPLRGIRPRIAEMELHLGTLMLQRWNL